MVFGLQAILISEKLVEKIASLQYVDLAELLKNYQESTTQKDDRKRKTKIKTIYYNGWKKSQTENKNHTAMGGRNRKPQIKTILQWVECFNVYVAVIAKYYPALVPD